MRQTNPCISIKLFLFLLGYSLAASAWAGNPSSVIPGAYFGNQSVVNGLASVIALDNDTKALSFSFLQRTNEQISAVWLHGTVEGTTCPDYNAVIYQDNGGIPGTSLGGDSHSMTTGWTKIGLLSPVQVSANTVYHVVINSGGGASSGGYYAVDAYTLPDTGWIPFDQFKDNNLFTTYNNGSAGFVQSSEDPVFAVEYANTDYGNPYESISDVGIGGVTQVSEVFQVPSANIWVTQVGAYLERIGGPSSDLQYQLVDVTAATTLTGTIATSATATTSLQWVDVALPGAPIQLLGTDQYQLIFSSASSGTNFYKVAISTDPDDGAPIQYNITYDGSNSFQAFSANSGVTWGNNLFSDLAFRFTVGSAPTVTPTPTNTLSVVGTPTVTSTNTQALSTATFTSTNTPTVPTSTFTPSYTPTLPDATFTLTATNTPTPVPTDTGTPTPTATSTATDTATPSATPTATSTFSATPTATLTPSQTPTSTGILATSTATPNSLLILGSNYFNPRTDGPLSLDSKLTKQGPVKILVYNLAGEEIRKILDSSQPAGDIHHSWDGRNKYGAVVGNGVYFILIETPDGNLIQKVIVLK